LPYMTAGCNVSHTSKAVSDKEPKPAPAPSVSAAPAGPSPTYWPQEIWREWRPELVRHSATLLISLTVLVTDFASVSTAVGILVGVTKLARSLGFTGPWADAILVFHKGVVLGALVILAWFLFRDLVHVHSRRRTP